VQQTASRLVLERLSDVENALNRLSSENRLHVIEDELKPAIAALAQTMTPLSWPFGTSDWHIAQLHHWAHEIEIDPANWPAHLGRLRARIVTVKAMVDAFIQSHAPERERTGFTVDQ
jgi:hypothetical protein